MVGLPFYLKRGGKCHSPIFQLQFLRRIGISHIVHLEVVTIIIVAIQPLLESLLYLIFLIISLQFIYLFLDDFVLHLSSITSKKNYLLVIFIETDQS